MRSTKSSTPIRTLPEGNRFSHVCEGAKNIPDGTRNGEGACCARYVTGTVFFFRWMKKSMPTKMIIIVKNKRTVIVVILISIISVNIAEAFCKELIDEHVPFFIVDQVAHAVDDFASVLHHSPETG